MCRGNFWSSTNASFVFLVSNFLILDTRRAEVEWAPRFRIFLGKDPACVARGTSLQLSTGLECTTIHTLLTQADGELLRKFSEMEDKMSSSDHWQLRIRK